MFLSNSAVTGVGLHVEHVELLETHFGKDFHKRICVQLLKGIMQLHFSIASTIILPCIHFMNRCILLLRNHDLRNVTLAQMLPLRSDTIE